MLREVVNFVVVPEETILSSDYDCYPPEMYDIPEYYKYPKMPFDFNFDLSEMKLRFQYFYRGKKVKIPVANGYLDSIDYDFVSKKEKIPKGNYVFILFSPSRERKNNKQDYLRCVEWVNGEYIESEWHYKIAYVIITKDHGNMAIRVGPDIDNPNKKYWLYQDKLYWENDGLDMESVKALIDAREGKKKRKIEFVKGPSTAKGKPSPRYISDDVKVTVWRRDGGRCIKCGSNENMEFDHVIPVALGGSSTERNIQLLCERCNREKGADLK